MKCFIYRFTKYERIHYTIISGPKTGKTSAIYNLLNQLDEKKYLKIYFRITSQINSQLKNERDFYRELGIWIEGASCLNLKDEQKKVQLNDYRMLNEWFLSNIIPILECNQKILFILDDIHKLKCEYFINFINALCELDNQIINNNRFGLIQRIISIDASFLNTTTTIYRIVVTFNHQYPKYCPLFLKR